MITEGDCLMAKGSLFHPCYVVPDNCVYTYLLVCVLLYMLLCVSAVSDAASFSLEEGAGK